MLKISNIDHLNLNVENLEKSIKFYEDLFSMKVKERGRSSSGSPYAIIGVKGQIYLCIYESNRKNQGSLNHLGLHIKNFDEVLSKLEKLGISPNYGGMVDYDNSRSVYITDPNGIEIELSENFGGGLQ